MRILLCLCIGLVFATFAAKNSEAHRLDETYVYFQVTETSITGRFEVLLPDLDQAVGIDGDGNGEITETELQAQSGKVFQFFLDRLSIQSNGTALTLTPGAIKRLETPIGTFGQIEFSLPGVTQSPEELLVDYEPLADVLNRPHSGFILIESNTRTGQADNEAYVSLVFDTGDEAQMLSLTGEPWHKVLIDFIEHGAWHIWIGFDHVVFLVLLLLPSVMMARRNRWVPLESFRPALWNTVKIVTVFTVSHSVTLSLAAFGVVELPATLVEAIIALSIIAVAIMHFFPNMHRYVLATVFVFGLFHGFGFANVLAPLGLDPTSRVVGIGAFNIGVELGQLAIVVVVFPIIWLFRRWRFYPPLAFKVGSVAMILLAGVWFLERTTDFEWNMRATLAYIVGIFQ